MTVKVLFVCLGNICRSPTAHAVFQQLVDAGGLGAAITVDSAGTGDWHIGKAPDERATRAGASRGYDLSTLRARRIAAIDFQHYDYILAMDLQNLRDLQQLRPADYRGELSLFLNYGNSAEREVPDPYYGEGDGFERVLDMVEAAAAGLLHAIVLRHGLQPARH
jgi:protein-tyrosine phosphatase